jgi:hypothetical protein
MQDFLSRYRIIPAVLLVILLTFLICTGVSFSAPQDTSIINIGEKTVSISAVLVSEYEPQNISESAETQSREILQSDKHETWSAINFFVTLVSLLAAMLLLLIFICGTVVSESPKISVLCCFMGIISGVIILILFISTQNLHKFAGLFDEYTLITLILFMIQLALIRFTFSKSSHRRKISQ